MGRILFASLILLLNITPGENDPYEVTGVIGKNTDLVFKQNFQDGIKEVDWKFNNGFKSFKVATFKDNKFEIELPQFQNVLEMLKDGMGLHIKDLTFNMSGTYIAKITLKDDTIYTESFILSLYEPVPAPSIRIVYENSTSDRCKVVVHCDVPGRATSVSYTWIYSYNSSDPKISNSNPIQMLLQPESSEVTCIVHNPAQSKNVSVTLKPCQQNVTETHPNRHHWPVVGSIVAVLLLSVASIRKCCKKEEELKCSVQETDHYVQPEKCIDPEDKPFPIDPEDKPFPIDPEDKPFLIDPEDKPFLISKNTVKYHNGFITVHIEKEDDKMAFDDGELSS